MGSNQRDRSRRRHLIETTSTISNVQEFDVLEKEESMSTFSESVIKLWNGWEIRVLLLISLLLQLILIALGSVRKWSRSIWIRFFLWSAYMSAEMVATIALGILARNINGSVSENNDSYTSNSIHLFWTPFLILHLGGPDTITAYSLEDNELWPRHFLGLVVQSGVAFYVFVKSWDDIRLKWIAIPVFVAGFLKYGERVWVLRTSSTKSIRNFLLSDPDPGPDYAEVMARKKRDPDYKLEPKKRSPQTYSGSRDDHLSQAYYLFNRLKYLFADLILGYYERQDCHFMISDKSSDEAFEILEGELGLLYDVLYTKATIVYSRYGFLLRCCSFFSSISAMVLFRYFVDVESTYSPVDVSITYLLLVGAVALEVYAFVLFVLSDWTKLWLVKYLKKVRIGKRWSRTMSKYNLVKFCLRKQDTLWTGLQKSLGIEEMVEKHLHVEHDDIDAELRSFIFQQLKERSKNINTLFDVSSCKELLNYRGEKVLGEMGCHVLKWSTTVEFDHSLILWHIATQICYYDDVKRRNGSDSLNHLNQCSKISKGLSDYMMYLLVMYPNMLPKGIGEIRYKDTCAEAIRFFQQRKTKIEGEIEEACHELYEVDTDSLEAVKGDETKSVLFYGCRLAKQLQTIESEKKWDVMNKVWVELLAYAAVHCGWKEHGQQLRRGGELLTHVCLLMAHLGLSEQYQIQKEYFQIREDKWAIHCAAACDPCLLPLLFTFLVPYWCCNQTERATDLHDFPLEHLDFS